MKIALLGSGNVATVLGRRMALSGHAITQVFSRNRDHAAALADELGCSFTDDWGLIDGEAGLYLVALSDHTLLSIGDRLSLPGKLVVHTAGSVSRDILQGVTDRYGVLYPLQSLRKEIAYIPEIPLLVDGNNADCLRIIADLAGTISNRVETADDATRSKLHLAGVMLNNFSNHLYALTAGYCRQEGIAFDLLLPLIVETAGRLAGADPRNVQTGPAVRGDEETIERHLNLLDNYKDIKELYRLVTIQIKERYGAK
jgi:predicted short-subunit dehydrogenase-like oxidoreductase (DUF2520 family)